MIQAWISKKDGRINQFKLTGHADSGEYGQDIVCAAVSVLSINTVNSIEQITSIKPEVISNDTEGGYMKVTVPYSDNHQLEDQIQTLLRSLEIGLTDVSESYGDYIKVNSKN